MNRTNPAGRPSGHGGATLDVSVLRAVIDMQHELAAVGLDLKAVMQRIADRTRELTGGTSAAVRLLDGDAPSLDAAVRDKHFQRKHGPHAYYGQR